MEDHLTRTIKAPRLQYDDEHDMQIFRGSEEKWLSSTGKSPDGSIHIPVSRAMEILAQRGCRRSAGHFSRQMWEHRALHIPRERRIQVSRRAALPQEE